MSPPQAPHTSAAVSSTTTHTGWRCKVHQAARCHPEAQPPGMLPVNWLFLCMMSHPSPAFASCMCVHFTCVHLNLSCTLAVCLAPRKHCVHGARQTARVQDRLNQGPCYLRTAALCLHLLICMLPFPHIHCHTPGALECTAAQ